MEQGSKSSRPTRLLSIALHLLMLVVAASALRSLWLFRLPLQSLWGNTRFWLASASLFVGVALLLGALHIARRRHRSERGFFAAELRDSLILFVGAAVVYLAWLQPFRPLTLEWTLGGMASLFGLRGVMLTRTRRALPTKLRFVIAFVLFNIAVILVAAEGVLRIFGTVKPSPLFAQVDVGVADWIDSLRYTPGALRFGFPCNSLGHYDDEFVDRGPNRRFVAMIGDSFSASIVPHAFHFSTVAEDELGLPVDNYGIPSIGPLEYLYLLKYEVLPRRPDVVIVNLFIGNDFVDAARVRRGAHRLRRWFDRANVLLIQVPRRLALLRKEQQRLGDGVVVGGVKGETGNTGRLETREAMIAEYPWLTDYRLEESQFSREGAINMEVSRIAGNCREGVLNVRAMTHALDAIARELEGRPFGVVLIPDLFQVEDAVWREASAILLQADTLERDLPQQALTAWLREHQVPFLDLLPVLRDVAPEEDGDRHLYHLHDSHFNAKGNRVAGLAMARFIATLLPSD